MEGSQLWPSKMEDWKITEGPIGYTPTTAYTYMNGAAELFIAYNMKGLTVVRYGHAKRPDIVAEIYTMASPEDAYGLFTFESDDPGGHIGQGSEFGGGLLRFWKGPYFVSVYGDGAGDDVEKATLAMGRHIASAITRTGKPPSILGLLPSGKSPLAKTHTWFLHSHILLNQRFFIAHANILNLGGDVEAALGRYGAGNQKMHFLLVSYPTGERANIAFDSFVKSYMPDAKGKSSVKTEDGKWTVAEKRGVYVAIAFDAPDEKYGSKIVETALAKVP
ncbi:MAG TPA: DUF6599 family protein [Syntrophorhabdaceae bacterium]